jgi:predicted Zn-dependent protease
MTDRALLDVLREAIDRSGEPEVELYARRARRGLARFASNVVGQHGEFDEVEVSARVARDRRMAVAATSRTEPDEVLQAIRDAAALCAYVPPVDALPGFTGPTPPPAATADPAASTRDATPADRTERLAPAFARATEAGLVMSGTLETTRFEAAVATSAGQAVYGAGAFASTRLFALAPDGASGYAGALDRELDALDIGALAAHAIERCTNARSPRALGPGLYDVVLEPAAVAELLEWMNMTGFGAHEVEKGSSFLAGREGERITGEAITVTDDAPALARLGLSVAFDREGTPSQPVTLVDRGIAQRPVYDRLHAARAGTVSTGHAGVGIDGEHGPSAKSLRVGPGNESPEWLVRGLERGLLVSRFHYVNGMLDPRRALMTGTTRDGTYWVESGEPVHAVKNLRFTDSILEAFARTDGIGDRVVAVPTWWSDWGATFVPAIRIRGLRFTGAAESQ